MVPELACLPAAFLRLLAQLTWKLYISTDTGRHRLKHYVLFRKSNPNLSIMFFIIRFRRGREQRTLLVSPGMKQPRMNKQEIRRSFFKVQQSVITNLDVKMRLNVFIFM